MLLAVAGMSKEQIDELTRRLAGDWSGLPAAEQAAYAFARKQALEPAAITDQDIHELESKMGPDRAWQVIWLAARYHYMTRVADAFQLPLERDNPFWNMPGTAKKKEKE